MKQKRFIISGCIILVILVAGIFLIKTTSKTNRFAYNGMAYSKVYMENESELIINATHKIMECVENGESVIDFTDLEANENTVQLAFMNARNYNPLCSVVSLKASGDMCYKIEYGCSDEQWKENADSLRNKVTQVIIDNVTKSDSDIEKAKAIYKYLSMNMEYDTKMLEKQDAQILFSYSLYDAIMEEKGVCFHFAQVFQYYLMQMGIDSLILTDYGVVDKEGTTDIFGRPIVQGMGHAWNLIKLDGEWYHCDITYENGYFQTQMESGDKKSDIEYRYWGMSDEKRAESRNSAMRSIFGTINPMNVLEVPECTNELK